MGLRFATKLPCEVRRMNVFVRTICHTIKHMCYVFHSRSGNDEIGEFTSDCFPFSNDGIINSPLFTHLLPELFIVVLTRDLPQPARPLGLGRHHGQRPITLAIIIRICARRR